MRLLLLLGCFAILVRCEPPIPPSAPTQPPDAPVTPPEPPTAPAEPTPTTPPAQPPATPTPPPTPPEIPEPREQETAKSLDCTQRRKVCTGLDEASVCKVRDTFELRLNIFTEDGVCREVAGFCPRIDEFAAIVPTGHNNKSIAACSPTGGRDIWIQAFSGNSMSPATPEAESPRLGNAMPFVLNNVEECSGGDVWIPEGAILFNVTLDKGVFKYQNVTDGNNQTKTVKVGTGFVSTCDKNSCKFSATSICAGQTKEHHGYCGQCVHPSVALDTAIASPVIYISYYGTDVNSRVLLSGGKNPLNFRKYSMNNVFKQVKTATTKLKTQLSEIQLLKKKWLW